MKSLVSTVGLYFVNNLKKENYMNKKNGIIVLIVVLSVAVIAGVGYKIADKFYAPLVQTKAVSYLCHKYNAKPDEFEMVDYNQAHITLDEYEIFFLKPRWVDFSFEYVYNGRHFVVCKRMGLFMTIISLTTFKSGAPSG